MNDNFAAAWHDLLDNEGGYSNNPADSGGATMYGITEDVARKNGYTGAMHALPLATAQAIARAEYWDPYQCDAFAFSVGFLLFDAAYNGGHPVKWLQQAVGVPVDGVLGPVTLAAVKAANPLAVAMKFTAYRIQYLTGLRSWPYFGRGWANRMATNLLRVAQG